MRGMVKAFALALLIVVVFSCNKEPSRNEGSPMIDNGNELKDSLSGIILDLRNKIDSLQSLDGREGPQQWFIEEIHAREMLQNGIEDPSSYIRSELQKRADLIPLKPVLGGKMAFRRIEILGSKWILAEYDDGHVLGRSIYVYRWNKTKGLQFTLLDSATR